MNTSQPGSFPTNTPSSRELGLDVAVIAARYLFKTDHLHYGYWPGDLPVEMANLKQAQENYADMIVRTIPAGAHTILDVGMGTGALAKRLTSLGYDVECVSPSPYLTQQGRQLLGDKHVIHECKYEDLKTDKRYDVVLFSESYQYIHLKRGLALTQEFLNANGHLLICDFFRKDTPQKGPFGGGHSLAEFRQLIELCPFSLLIDRDITPQTAPNLDLVADCVTQVVLPIKERLFSFIAAKYPLPYRALTWMFRRDLARMDDKYATGQRSGANFQNFKSYRLLLFAKGPQPKDVAI